MTRNPASSRAVNPPTAAGTRWMHQAACRSEDPELFFPIGTTNPALRQLEDAKAICRRCPVTDVCLAWALKTGQDAGVWGGKSTDARRRLRRRQTRADRRKAS